jgi:hypothetical protein
VGAAVTTDSEPRHAAPPPARYHDHAPSRGFCPPGQARKGRC